MQHIIPSVSRILAGTTQLNAANPFDYLVSLLRYHEEAAKAPADWMPWNYQDSVVRLTKVSSP